MYYAAMNGILPAYDVPLLTWHKISNGKLLKQFKFQFQSSQKFIRRTNCATIIRIVIITNVEKKTE